MTVATFNARVSLAIRRGTSLNTQIPGWVAEAVREVEQNYTFSWMRKAATQTLAADTNPARIAFPSNVKSFEWIKVIDESGSDDGTNYYRELLGVDPGRISGISSGYISGYWLDGVDWINFDAVPTEDVDLFLRYNQYSTWPAAYDDATTPAILARAEGVLLAETMIIFALESRDSRMAGDWAQIRQDRMNRLLRSEEDLKLDHQNDLVMRQDLR